MMKINLIKPRRRINHQAALLAGYKLRAYRADQVIHGQAEEIRCLKTLLSLHRCRLEDNHDTTN